MEQPIGKGLFWGGMWRTKSFADARDGPIVRPTKVM